MNRTWRQKSKTNSSYTSVSFLLFSGASYCNDDITPPSHHFEIASVLTACQRRSAPYKFSIVALRQAVAFRVKLVQTACGTLFGVRCAHWSMFLIGVGLTCFVVVVVVFLVICKVRWRHTYRTLFSSSSPEDENSLPSCRNILKVKRGRYTATSTESEVRGMWVPSQTGLRRNWTLS